SVALAEPPEWAGGGRGGGGKPSAPALYGDTLLIDRDVNGVPIMTDGLGPRDQLTRVPWPIMLGPRADCELWPLDGDPLTERPEGEEGPVLEPVAAPSLYFALGVEAYRIPFVDYEIPEDYATYCTKEAEFGRMSSARAPDEVIGHALLEMVTTLSQADEPGELIKLDPAGRLEVLYATTDENGIEIQVDKTIDAPLENLAGFERVLERAALYHDDVNGGEPIDMPARPDTDTGARHLLDRAAAMLGAAGDKTGHIGIDEVAYVSLFRAIPADMQGNTFGGTFTDENGVEYFNFSAFEYSRSGTYEGVEVCYLRIDGVNGTDVDATVVVGDVYDLVFDSVDFGDGVEGANIWAFAQAADDARAVINWVHENPVPVELVGICDGLYTEAGRGAGSP
ncbi:MAG: hypothetical protein P8080_10460, partial [Gammaproteobacteria bacterium]